MQRYYLFSLRLNSCTFLFNKCRCYSFVTVLQTTISWGKQLWCSAGNWREKVFST